MASLLTRSLRRGRRLGRILRRYRGPADWALALRSGKVMRADESSPDRGRVVEIRVRGYDRPVAARLGTSDFSVVEDVLVNGEYDAAVCRTGGEPTRTVVDLGSNIGVTLLLWERAFPGARVVAVEPDATNFDLLTRNAEAGVRAGRIVPLLACVAGRARSVSLDRTGEPWAFRLRENEGGHRADAIEALTLPQVLERAGIDGDVDLLKCDIEGAEREVFADCAGWIGRVRTMVVELHAPYRREEFLADLARNGARSRCTVVRSEAAIQILLVEREEPR